MSMVVSDGRIIRARVDVAYDLLMSARKDAVVLGLTMEACWLAARSARIVDHARMSGTSFGKPLHQAWCEMDDRRREIARTKRRDPLVDIGLELWLFPQRMDTLVIARSEQPRLIHWFDGLRFVDDRCWWDNADRPDGVSSSEWTARRKDWNRVLPAGSTPDERCLSLTMCGPNRLPPDPETVLREILPLTQRIDDMTKERHVMEMLGMLQEQDGRTTDLDGTMRLYGRARKAAESDPDGRDAIRRQVEERLAEITLKDLVG